MLEYGHQPFRRARHSPVNLSVAALLFLASQSPFIHTEEVLFYLGEVWCLISLQTPAFELLVPSCERCSRMMQEG